MLSSAPPSVAGVEVLGTNWTSSFVGYLQGAGQGTAGYKIPLGSAAQSASLTWNNINQIAITFNEDVNVKVADLSLSGVNVVAYHFSGFQYNSTAHTATWTLNTPIANDRLRLDLDADGIDPVHNSGGVVLDGEWSNNSSIVSGNGTAGGDFEFNFNVLPTDVNNSASITSYDYVYIRQLDGKSVSSSGYNATRDTDGNGIINSLDWQEALNRVSQQLPTGVPVGAYDDAPTTVGLSRVRISNEAVDTAIALLSSFADKEDGSSNLTYSVVSNSNASLFSTATIDPATHSLVLKPASAGVSGHAVIAIRATDSLGLSVDTTVSIDVAPPTLSCAPAYVGGGTWVIEGHVSDSMYAATSITVQCTGLFSAQATPDEDGDFAVAVILGENAYGWENVVAINSAGAQSDVIVLEIVLT
jgi:hypothetical protein